MLLGASGRFFLHSVRRMRSLNALPHTLAVKHHANIPCDLNSGYSQLASADVIHQASHLRSLGNCCQQTGRMILCSDEK